MRDWTASRVASMPRVGSRLSLDCAERAKAHGVDVLKTSGTPHTPPPPHVLEAASRAARDNGTAPSQGLPELREAIAAKLRRDNGIAVDPGTDVLVTSGAQQGLLLAIVGTLEAGDEIVVPTPTYFIDALVTLSGAKPLFVPLEAATGYALDPERLERAISPRAKAILLVNPSNPGGHVATAEELHTLAALARRHNLLLIADESYERIVYDGRTHLSVGGLPDLAGQVVTIHSCSKTYALAGWRVGYIAAPASLVAELRKLFEWVQLGSDYVSQRAALAALAGPQEWTLAIRDAFQRNRDRLIEEAGKLPNVSYVIPEGNPNLFLDFTATERPASEIAAYLLERHGIRTTPGEYFQTPGHVRLEFGGELETIAEAGRRLARAAAELNSAMNRLG